MLEKTPTTSYYMLNKEKQKMITQNVNNKQMLDGLAHNFFEYQEETHKQIDNLFCELQDKFDKVSEAFKLHNRPPFNGGGNRLESYFQHKLRDDYKLRKRIYLKKIIVSFIFGFMSCLIMVDIVGRLPSFGNLIFIAIGGLVFFGVYYISLGSDPD